MRCSNAPAVDVDYFRARLSYGAAAELAKRASIRLLVPGNMVPEEPDKPGPHKWMQRNLTSSDFIISQYETSIICEDDVSYWINEQIENNSGQTVSVVLSNSDTIPLSEFIRNNLQAYLDELEKENPNTEFKKLHIFEFKELNAIIDEVPFKFAKIKIDATFIKEIYKPKFKMTAFIIPESNKVLGFIGLNEYENHRKIRYLMFAMKWGNMSDAVFAFRDPEGKPVKNQKIEFLMEQYPAEMSTNLIKIKGV